METRRTLADDEVDRQTVLNYVQSRPGQSFEEAEIRLATHVPKMHVRRLMHGVPGIDEAKLDAGKVCWNPPAHPNTFENEGSA